MSWQVIVDEGTALRVYGDIDDLPSDVPLDGILFVIADDMVHQGYERYFYATDDTGPFWGVSNDAETDIVLRYPGARICRGKTTTTDLWYAAKKWALLYAGHTVEPVIEADGKETIVMPNGGAVTLPPSPVSLVGWKVWTSREVIASTGVGATDWFSHWEANVDPDDVQRINTYINWPTGPNGLGRHIIEGSDFYLFSPHASGQTIIHGTKDPEAELLSRYPGSSLKRGRFINTQRLQQIVAEADADWMD